MLQPRSAKERDPDSTRQAILAAAEEEFAQKGFSGARIDEIAARSGYNKSLIFHYFENKMGIYHAVIACTKGNVERQIHTELLASLESADPLDAEEVRGVIQRGVAAYFDFLSERPTLRRILSWEAAENWTIYRSLPTLQQGLQQKFHIFVAYLRRAQAAGYLRADLDPMMLIVNIIGMGLIHLNSLPRYEGLFPDADLTSPMALAHAREQLIRLVLYGAMAPTSFGEVE